MGRLPSKVGKDLLWVQSPSRHEEQFVAAGG